MQARPIGSRVLHQLEMDTAVNWAGAWASMLVTAVLLVALGVMLCWRPCVRAYRTLAVPRRALPIPRERVAWRD